MQQLMTEKSTEDIWGQMIQIAEYKDDDDDDDDDDNDIMQTPICSEETKCLNKVTKLEEGSTSGVPEHI
jgi:hypothetical protein